MDTVKVKFSQGAVTSEEHPQRFEAGKVYDLRPDIADRWIRRGKAERVAGDEPETVKTPAPKKPGQTVTA